MYQKYSDKTYKPLLVCLFCFRIMEMDYVHFDKHFYAYMWVKTESNFV